MEQLLLEISKLGLPGWVWIIAGILLILRIVGILDPLISVIREKIESGIASERAEQIAVLRLQTELQSSLMDDKSQLTEFLIDANDGKLDTIIGNQEKIIQRQSKLQRQQDYRHRELSSKFSMMLGLWTEDHDKRPVVVEDDENTTQNQAIDTEDTRRN